MKIPWSRAWQPIPVFLPGEFHEQRSLEGYSPWGCKESDITEQLSTAQGNLETRKIVYKTIVYEDYNIVYTVITTINR